MFANYQEFKDKCPYCQTSNLDIWDHSLGFTIACKTCWNGDFGWSIRFDSQNRITNDAKPFSFIVWNGKYEAWFYFGASPYLDPKTVLDRTQFFTLIVNQGPSSDNPIDNRLQCVLKVKKSRFKKIFQNRKYVRDWIDKMVENKNA